MYKLSGIAFCIFGLLGSQLMAQECNASFYSEQDSSDINTFHFYNTSNSNINAAAGYFWDMDDGTTYQTENVTHQFATPGTWNVSLSMQVPICTGTIEAIAEGGNPPYSFVWSNGYTEESDSLSIQDSLCPGNYQVSITDMLGDSIAISIELEDMTGDILQLALTYENCLSEFPDSCTGSIDASVSGGAPPYTYNWNTGSDDPEITDLCTGNYIITVCDANDACITDSIDLPVYECSVTDYRSVSGDAVCDGYIEFSVNGGEEPYTYTWSPGVNHTDNTYTSQTGIDLCAGSYIITVMDATGSTCMDSAELNPLDFDFTVTDTPANGNCNGKIIANPVYGTPPYTYNWSTGETDSINEGICSGWHYCTICDSELVCKEDSIEISDLALSSNINWRGPSGPAACDGYIHAYINGGIPPYSFSWEPETESLEGYNFSLLNNLCSGTYILTTCDSEGTCITDTINLNDKPFNVDITPINPNQGICNGKIHVSATGASPPYNFLWSNGDECLYQTSCSIIDLCAGVYYVTISDFENNTVYDSVELSSLPGGPEITEISLSLPSPPDVCNASAVVEAVGQEPLSFTWSTDSWQESNISGIENQCAGTYYFTVCDVNNLCIQDSVQLFELSAHIKNLQHPYNENCNGSIEIMPDGGYPPCVVNWQDGYEGNSISDLCPGWHYYQISDNFGNTYQDSVQLINQNIAPLESNHNIVQTATINNHCQNVISHDITSNWHTSIRGMVYMGDTPLPNGVVILFSKEEEKYTARQLSRVNNGHYQFQELGLPSYAAFAIPVLTSGMEYFPVYYPTYFGNVPNWEDAQFISLSDTAPKNIHLYKTEEIQHGQKMISGQLLYQANTGFEENIFLQDWYDFDPPGIPETGLARHIPVYLMTEDFTYLKQSLTDHQGKFEFRHLAEGNYRLHFEKPGKDCIYSTHAAGDSLTDLVYIMDDQQIRLLTTGIEETDKSRTMLLFPNPVYDECKVTLPEPVRENIRINIYNESGMMVFHKEIKRPGQVMKLDLSDLSPGFYTIMIQSPDEVFRHKFIKK